MLGNLGRHPYRPAHMHYNQENERIGEQVRPTLNSSITLSPGWPSSVSSTAAFAGPSAFSQIASARSKSSTRARSSSRRAACLSLDR